MSPFTRRILHRFDDDRRGTTSIEYCVIAGLIALGLVLSLGTIGGSLGSVFSAVAGGFDGNAPQTAPSPPHTNGLGGGHG